MHDAMSTTRQSPQAGLAGPHPNPLPEYRERGQEEYRARGLAEYRARGQEEYRARGLALPVPPPVRPLSRCAVSVRPATAGDLAFIDRLQKLHGKMVGWMPTKQLEQKIAAGQVLVAEENAGLGLGLGLRLGLGEEADHTPTLTFPPNGGHADTVSVQARLETLGADVA